MKKWTAWFFCFFIIYASAFGQKFGELNEKTSQITGQVIEASSGKPIFGANVLIRGTMLGAATESDGSFKISHVPSSNYTIMVTAVGYKSGKKTVSVESDSKIDILFSLQETVILMDGIAVTASRYRQSLEDLPVSLSLVSAKELQDRNITSAEQALRYVPGVNSMEGGQISIRGSSGFNWGMGSRVLVLFNGNPIMSGDNWNVNWYAIPTSNIKQIEVLKGSGSALYGSSAMGGVINIITKEPEQGSHIHIRSFTGFHNKPSHSGWRWTDDQSHFEGTSLDFSTYLGPVSTQLSTTYQATTGYRENDDRETLNCMANLNYDISSSFKFGLMTGYGTKSGGFFIYWKGLQDPYGNGSDPHGYKTRSKWNSTYVFPSITYIFNNRIFLTLKGKYNRSFSEDHLKSTAEGSPEQTGTFRSSTANTQGFDTQINVQVSSRGIMVAGCDFQKDEVESIQYGHRKVSKASYYFQFEQRFWDRLNVTLGTRWDGEDAQEIGSVGELSRKIGLNLAVSKWTNIRFNIGEGFRTPAVCERFVSTFASGLRISPNPELRPELSKSAEIGFKQALTNSMNMDMAVFYTEYKNLIEPQLDTDPDLSVVVRFKNIVRARVMGVDLSYVTDWWSNMVSTRIGYTFIDTKDLSAGEEYNLPLKYRSKHTLYFTNDLTLKPLQIGIDFRYLSKIERVDQYHTAFIQDIENVVPTYVTSIRLGVSWKHQSFRLLIDNLFQYNYLVSPANIGPPRTAVLQFNVNY